jgi:hypothetical protein
MSATGPDKSAGSRRPSEAREASAGGVESAADRTGAYDPQPAGDETAGIAIASKYTPRKLIGEGGMGSAWKAHQSEPVNWLVAVNLIKMGMYSRQVVARLEAERQAFAFGWQEFTLAAITLHRLRTLTTVRAFLWIFLHYRSNAGKDLPE